jgi:hypothetical protein
MEHAAAYNGRGVDDARVADGSCVADGAGVADGGFADGGGVEDGGSVEDGCEVRGDPAHDTVTTSAATPSTRRPIVSATCRRGSRPQIDRISR